MQNLVSEVDENLFLFMFFGGKCSNRQVWCEFHNLNKFHEKGLYYKIVCNQNKIILQNSSGEK